MNTIIALNRLRRTALIAALTLFGVMGSVVWAMVPYMRAWFEQQAKTHVAACDCAQFIFSRDHLPLLIGVGTAILVFTVLVLRAIIKTGLTIAKTKQYEQSLRERILHTTTVRGVPFFRVQEERPFAVCLGYFRPRVYISISLERLLKPHELLTVINHELYHAQHRDPLQRLMMGALAALLPASKRLAHDYTTLQELAADEAVGDDTTLRRALIKTLGVARESQATSAVWFSATDARLNRLLGHRIQPTMPWSLVIIVGSLIVLTVALYNSLTTTAEVHAFGQCVAVQPMCEAMMSYVVF